ncbi:PTS transporter subunit EIIC [Irregularibacter muris]|uniref:PTS transporter subunit EIIC n=1 Tax=Irregularibacter muris TaxID=1796619 RepID=A0AAE3KZG4_9FIRM|nr:PTS transporter subunit EIIC [Irregularibacter muris]MCR1898262.1 PTS transporter subunit EIIC [Irregularibacter muris]
MSFRKRASEEIQRFGRTLLLPIAVMAPVGMVLGLTGALTQSYMIERLPFLGNATLQLILNSLKGIADIIFSNIPVLFAMGVAYGLSKKDKGIAVFSAIISYLVLNASINVWLSATGNLADPEVMGQVGQGIVLGIQTIRLEALGGIISGIIGALVTDRFYNLQFPLALAFFSGKKSVPIISTGISIVVGLILPFFWQYITKALIALSFILISGPFGTFIFRIMNRILIPFGLHHVWNSLIRFSEAGGTYMIDGEKFVGVIPTMNKILFELGPNHEAWNILPELTRFMAQNQMLLTLFMIPAVGFAMYRSAYAENKPYTKGLILTMVLTPFLGNVTEPLEFSFLFISPVLYGIYVLLNAIGAVALHLMGTAVGYIRGTIFDFAIFGLLYENTKWYNLLIVGIPLAIATYFVFMWAIKKWNVATPGREEETVGDNTLLKEKRYDEVAKIVVEALGGKSNVLYVENCVTRLRVDLKDYKLVDTDKIKESGTSGVFFPTKNHIHVVFGPNVEFVRNAVDDFLASDKAV